jgi:hypothetical protein
MIFSDLPSPAEAGFALGSGRSLPSGRASRGPVGPARAQAPAGNRFRLFGIMHCHEKARRLKPAGVRSSGFKIVVGDW